MMNDGYFTYFVKQPNTLAVKEKFYLKSVFLK